MLKLMKYEFRKTWYTKAIMLVVTAIAQALYMIGLYGERDGALLAGMIFLFFLAVGSILIMGLESVVTLHRDMNTKQSHMLFMTPNTSYGILGAKVLECGISILLAGAFYFALGVLDFTLLFAKMGELNTLWEYVQSFLADFTINGRPLVFDVQTMSLLTFSQLSGWILLIVTAYLAVVISSSLLNGKKLNGAVSFFIFLALEGAAAWLTRAVTSRIASTAVAMTTGGLIYLVIAGVMYYVSALLMDKYLSV
ncbi:MAG: hypothetical protein IJJ23_01960 [Clostridia bacterium]|nr:hypothetical protein [Clostridia bacterium]